MGWTKSGARTRAVQVVDRLGRVQTRHVRTDKLGTLYGQAIVNARGKKAWTPKDSAVRALEAVRGAPLDVGDDGDDLIELEWDFYDDY